MISDSGAPDHRAQGTCSGPWCNIARLLHAVLFPPELTRWLVEPGLDEALPILMEMAIRNHIITLTHLEGCNINSNC